MGITVKQDNRDMAWGRQYEKEAIGAFEVETGLIVEPTGFWAHPKYDWLGASPDGLIGEHGLIEVKNPRRHPETMPVHHRIQCLIGLACSERHWAAYATYTDYVKLYPLPDNHTAHQDCLSLVADAHEVEELIDRLEAFYRDFIVPGKEPPRQRRKGKVTSNDQPDQTRNPLPGAGLPGPDC
jgi:hypothetical protein